MRLEQPIQRMSTLCSSGAFDDRDVAARMHHFPCIEALPR